MMTIEANLVVHGGNINDYSEDLQEEFATRYNEIIDGLNTALPRLNAHWDRMYSGDLVEGSWMWYAYGQFISTYERDLCMNNNLQKVNIDSRIFMDTINENGCPVTIGIIDHNPNLYFKFVPSIVKAKGE